jgi:hypothetical protein
MLRRAWAEGPVVVVPRLHGGTARMVPVSCLIVGTEFKRETGLAGWQYFLNESLKGYLEKH